MDGNPKPNDYFEQQLPTKSSADPRVTIKRMRN